MVPPLKEDDPMTKFKTTDHNDQTIRQLDDAELNTVGGGALDNCILTHTITGVVPNTGWTFKDLWAKPTLGTYH
jgi:hypothetical protein